jgi:ribonucleoside-triphosphate reductase
VTKYIKALPKGFIDSYRTKPVDFGPVGYVVYKRTYARIIEDQGRTEEWFETIGRCVNGLLDMSGKFTQEEATKLYDHVFNFRCCFSGRALWQLGTGNMKRIGADSLQNCWAVAVNDPIDSFCFAFNQLMLGGGVGFNIMPEEVYSLPSVAYAPDIKHVDTFDCDYVVPDNREGWVKLLGRILKSHFYTDRPVHFCTKGIRSRGQKINTFGGTASGDVDLIWGMMQIVKILRGALGRKLRPVECLDIMNIIGKIVVSGNVRRSAMLALGDARDLEYMDAKNWATGKIPAWRGMSNNSVQCDNLEHLPESFWSGYNGDGEPYGFINLGLCRSHGRLVDGAGYRPDPFVIGTNPCAEITLANKEPCNLFEQFMCRIHDLKTWKEVAYLSYKVAKTVSIWPFSDPDTQDIVEQHHRLGVSCTGIQQAHWWGPRQYNSVYQHMECADEVYSRLLGVKRSNKLTTVKPSGTLSLLPDYEGGVITPGVNDGYSEYHNRRISFAVDDPLVETARAKGYHIEPKRELDGTVNYSTMVVTFPVKQVGGKRTSAIHQLKRHKLMQTYWSDNAVSTTVYYERHELDGIKAYLRKNIKDSIKSVSFLLHSEHGFEQAPLEEITEAEYNERKSQTKQITQVSDTKELSLAADVECEGGHCPIK